MQKTDAELTTEAQVIRDETTALANTKLRVYNILKNIVDSKVNNADAASSVWGDITGTITDQTDLVTYIAAQLAALIDSSPSTLDTLNELAAALGDDPNFATTVATALGLKANAADLTSHISDATDAHAGSAITNTPAGNISATTVQAAINELDTEKSPKFFTINVTDDVIPITTGNAKITFRMPFAMTLSSVRASLTVPQTSGSILTVDINEGGSTILSTKLTIDNTETTSTTAATAPVISDASLADNAVITIDVDQVGDGTATGLKVYFLS